MIKNLLPGLTVVAIAGAGVAIAQQSGIKRTPLQKLDFPAGYNTITAIAEVPAGGAAGRHTHPGAVLFPYYRRRGNVALIGMSSARASAPFMATGHVDSATLPILRDELMRAGKQGLFRVVMIHHPPTPDATKWHKRLVGSGRVRRT